MIVGGGGQASRVAMKMFFTNTQNKCEMHFRFPRKVSQNWWYSVSILRCYTVKFRGIVFSRKCSY
jgi:hypothetical protein